MPQELTLVAAYSCVVNMHWISACLVLIHLTNLCEQLPKHLFVAEHAIYKSAIYDHFLKDSSPILEAHKKAKHDI